jgi:hypothetical protein
MRYVVSYKYVNQVVYKQHEQSCTTLVCFVGGAESGSLCVAGGSLWLFVRRFVHIWALLALLYVGTRTVRKEYEHSGTCMFFAILDVPLEQGWRCRCRCSPQGLLLSWGRPREEFVPWSGERQRRTAEWSALCLSRRPLTCRPEQVRGGDAGTQRIAWSWWCGAAVTGPHDLMAGEMEMEMVGAVDGPSARTVGC